jgi:hypothetical protein
MRRTQRRVLLCVTSLRSRGPSLLLRNPVLPRNLATHGEARGRDGRQDAAALRYRCTVAFLEVSEFQQLPHGAITPQYFYLFSSAQRISINFPFIFVVSSFVFEG